MTHHKLNPPQRRRITSFRTSCSLNCCSIESFSLRPFTSIMRSPLRRSRPSHAVMAFHDEATLLSRTLWTTSCLLSPCGSITMRPRGSSTIRMSYIYIYRVVVSGTCTLFDRSHCRFPSATVLDADSNHSFECTKSAIDLDGFN